MSPDSAAMPEAMIVLHTAMGKEQFCEEPTARNSKRFPQNGKGAVRLRSSTPHTAGMAAAAFGSALAFSALYPNNGPPPMMASTCCSKPTPGYKEMIAGGASC